MINLTNLYRYILSLDSGKIESFTLFIVHAYRLAFHVSYVKVLRKKKAVIIDMNPSCKLLPLSPGKISSLHVPIPF